MAAIRYKQQWFENPVRDMVAGSVVALALIPEAIAFSLIAGVAPLGGHLASFCMAVVIAFVGARSGKPSQFRIHLIRNWSGEPHGGRVGDTGYSGVEFLPDGSILCTAYVKRYPDARRHSVVSTRFRVEGNTVK